MPNQHQQPHGKASGILNPYEALGVARTATVDESGWSPLYSPVFYMSSALFRYSPPIVQAEGAGDSPRQTPAYRLRGREEFDSGAIP